MENDFPGHFFHLKLRILYKTYLRTNLLSGKIIRRSLFQIRTTFSAKLNSLQFAFFTSIFLLENVLISGSQIAAQMYILGLYSQLVNWLAIEGQGLTPPTAR